MRETPQDKQLLDSINPEKREFVGKLIKTGAFVAPVVASFAMASLTPVEALASNTSQVP